MNIPKIEQALIDGGDLEVNFRVTPADDYYAETKHFHISLYRDGVSTECGDGKTIEIALLELESNIEAQ